MEQKDLSINSELIDACRQGSSEAQYRLYKLYSKAMFNLAYRITGNREDAEDMLQEAFIECFRNLSSFRFESTFGAWLKSIIVNRSINLLRKKKVELILLDNLPDQASHEEPEPEYETGVIFRCIESLPDGYRVRLTLYLLEGYDHAEIAQILGITESTSKSQYSRAKEKLRNLIRKSYGQS